MSKKTGVSVHPHLLRHTFATLWLKNGGDSLMLQRLLGHTTLMMTNRYCQAVGCYDAVEAHKRFSPMDNLGFKKSVLSLTFLQIYNGLPSVSRRNHF